MNFAELKKYTAARIGLGISGASMPTKALLSFNWHHAIAKDIIDLDWQTDNIIKDFPNAIILNTIVKNRQEYILRPDYGCKLHPYSINLLNHINHKEELLICASNGLSSLALDHHLLSLLHILLPMLITKLDLAYKNIFLIPNARIGIVNAIADILRSKVAIIFIGERPGLSSYDSLGAYITYAPHLNSTNAERHCLSNIRPPHGLDYIDAAQKIILLLKAMLKHKISGIGLGKYLLG